MSGVFYLEASWVGAVEIRSPYQDREQPADVYMPISAKDVANLAGPYIPLDAVRPVTVEELRVRVASARDDDRVMPLP